MKPISIAQQYEPFFAAPLFPFGFFCKTAADDLPILRRAKLTLGEANSWWGQIGSRRAS